MFKKQVRDTLLLKKVNPSNELKSRANVESYSRDDCESYNLSSIKSDSHDDLHRCRDDWDSEFGGRSVRHGVRTLNGNFANDATRVQMKGTQSYHGTTESELESHRGARLHRRSVSPGTIADHRSARTQKLSTGDYSNNTRQKYRIGEDKHQGRFQSEESEPIRRNVSENRKAFSKEVSVPKCYVPQVKLGIYKGDTCLETFLAKFENISSYMKWQPDDRLFYLQNSLEGPAGQILWDAGQLTSDVDIIRLLRARFGNQNKLSDSVLNCALAGERKVKVCSPCIRIFAECLLWHIQVHLIRQHT
jgi:hypothetical protein